MQHKTCTITNTALPGTLVISKIVVNGYSSAAQASDFTMVVNATSPSMSSFPGGTNTVVMVNAGSYSVDELQHAGYAKELSPDCAGTITNGETKYCNITNTAMAPTLTVVKIVLNTHGGTLNASDVKLFVGTTEVQSNLSHAFDIGTYQVSEGSVSGYVAAFSGDCSASGMVNLSLGDSKTCIITNMDEAATITVMKHVVNRYGGTLNESDAALSLNGSRVQNGVPNMVPAGTYVVNEAPVHGYEAMYSGDCDANGTVSVSVGQNKTCVIENHDIAPNLTVNKIVSNTHGGTRNESDFALFVNGKQVHSGEVNILVAGTYIITENATPGYTGAFTSEGCGNGTVVLEVGDSKVCNITNSDIAAALTVIKLVNNTNGGALQPANFILYVNGTQVTSGQQNLLSAGTYAVSEGSTAGYTASFNGDCDANGTVVLEIGQSKTCFITNHDMPATLTITKEVINDDGGNLSAAQFPLFVGAVQVASGVPASFSAGTYQLSELQQPGYTLRGYSGDCSANGIVTLAPGENKTCTITNDDLPKISCEEAAGRGLLTARIINGNATVVNMANQSYEVSLVSYKMYALTIFDQTLFGSQSAVVGAGSSANLSISVPACAYQIEVVCGAPLQSVPDYGNRTIAFDFMDQQNLCVHNQTGDVSLAVAPYFPQGGSYVFVCSAQGFTPTAYDWYFGDGQFQLNSLNSNVYHTYSSGSYTAQCVARNDNRSGADTLAISIAPAAPNATTADQTSNQTGSGNQTGNNTGGETGGNNQTDSNNRTGEIDSTNMTLSNVSLSIAPYYPQANSYIFQCNATGFTPTGYDWYFGDGSFLPGVANDNVHHTFLANGTYDVICSATNGMISGNASLPVTVGANGTVTSPNSTNLTNQTGQTNQTGNNTGSIGNNTSNSTGDQTGNQTGCFTSATTMPVNCTGGTITQDTVSGVCRTIVCQNNGTGMRVLACDKPDRAAPVTYYELYLQESFGLGSVPVTQVCVGQVCVGENGFARSASFPICIGNAAPPNGTGNDTGSGSDTGNQTGASAALSIAPWYPQGSNYVFQCNTTGFTPTSYDWFFGDGQMLLNISNDNVYHTFTPGSFTVTCVARNGATSASTSMQVTPMQAMPG
jgi:hypothetical protein